MSKFKAQPLKEGNFSRSNKPFIFEKRYIKGYKDSNDWAERSFADKRWLEPIVHLISNSKYYLDAAIEIRKVYWTRPACTQRL